MLQAFEGFSSQTIYRISPRLRPMLRFRIQRSLAVCEINNCPLPFQGIMCAKDLPAWGDCAICCARIMLILKTVPAPTPQG